MDILKNKQSIVNYDAISRYAPFYYYYNTKDHKFIFGLTQHLSTNIEYVAHKIKEGDTLEALAQKYYGRPDYYWIIADFNRLGDSFIELDKNYTIIRIPSLGQIYFEGK